MKALVAALALCAAATASAQHMHGASAPAPGVPDHFVASSDKPFAALMNDAALWPLFVIGLAALACFGWRDIRASLVDPRRAWLPPRRRWLLTALGPGMMLAAALPEVWWGGLALAHAPPG